MHAHLRVCIFEPVKETVRGFVKEIRQLRACLELQDEELTNLRGRLSEIESGESGKPRGPRGSGRVAAAEQQAQRGPGDDARQGEGCGEIAGDCHEKNMRAVQRQIIQWTPQVNAVTLEGHSDGVTCLGHSVEHKKLLSGALDRTIRVWDLTLHEPLCQAELRGHRGSVTGLAVSTSKLVSGSADMTLKVWDLGTLKEEAKFLGHSGLIHGVILLNQMCITTSQDKSIKIWDIRARESVTSIETKSRGQYGLAVHELKLLSASGSKIYTWDLRKVAAASMNDEQRVNFGRYETLTGNTSDVFGHQMVGDRLYTSAVDNSVRLWDLRSLQVKCKIVGHTDFVRALATAGARLLTASDDKTIRVWDLEFHDCARVLKGHSSYITALLCARAPLFGVYGQDNTYLGVSEHR